MTWRRNLDGLLLFENSLSLSFLPTLFPSVILLLPTNLNTHRHLDVFFREGRIMALLEKKSLVVSLKVPLPHP